MISSAVSAVVSAIVAAFYPPRVTSLLGGGWVTRVEGFALDTPPGGSVKAYVSESTTGGLCIMVMSRRVPGRVLPGEN